MTAHTGKFTRQKTSPVIPWKEPCHFRLYFLMCSLFENEKEANVGGLNPVTSLLTLCVCVCLSLWLSESFLLLGFFSP